MPMRLNSTSASVWRAPSISSDASRNHKEVYFGLKREYMEYDDVFSEVITQTGKELASADTPPPSFMIFGYMDNPIMPTSSRPLTR